MCLCTNMCFCSNKKSASISEGHGAFAEHHWHCLGEHCWVLLCNPNSQRGSQHSRSTAACSSPPGGPTSKGRCFLQHMRQAESAKYKQPSVAAPIPPFVYFHTQGTKVSSIFWVVFCNPTSCLFFCIRERVKMNNHVPFVISHWICQRAGRRQRISEISLFLFNKVFMAFL